MVKRDTEMTETSLQADVVIVGGGPTGLLLASELALAGVRVVVLERRPARVEQPRALGMHSRSVEVLALRGIAKRFIDRGVPIPFGHYGALETFLNMGVLDSRYPFVLIIPQTMTETLLQERALELGADLRRGWTVETVSETETGVRVAGTAEDGGTFEVEAKYLVGADGSRSLVRSQSNIAFVGKDADKTFYFGDVTLSGVSHPGMIMKRN